MNKLLETEKVNYLKSDMDCKKCLLDAINEDFRLEFIYNQVVMEEKNKVKKEQIFDILQGKKTDLTEREVKEVKNMNEALNKLVVMFKDERKFDQELIKDLHEEVVKNIMQGGIYRNVNIQIIGAIHQPPDPIKVYVKMERYFDKLEQLEGMEKITYAHAELAKIHPFLDGNGRLTRLVLNYLLLQNGYVPILIDFKDKKEYIRNLEIYKVEKNIKPLQEFFEKLLLKRYENLNK